MVGLPGNTCNTMQYTVVMVFCSLSNMSS